MLKGFTKEGIIMVRLTNGKEMTLKDYIAWEEDYNKVPCSGICHSCKFKCCENNSTK